MKKYIIIVHVYDEENSQAYPLGGVFDTHKSAEKYIADHWKEVKSNHWASQCEDGKDGYREEFTIGGGWTAQDSFDGASIEINIHTLEEIWNK